MRRGLQLVWHLPVLECLNFSLGIDVFALALLTLKLIRPWYRADSIPHVSGELCGLTHARLLHSPVLPRIEDET